MPSLLIVYSVALFAVIIVLHYVMGRVTVAGVLFLNTKMDSWNLLKGKALYWASK
jgi:hypothetical protein